MQQKTSFTYPLTPQQQQALYRILKDGNYRFKSVPYALIAAETPEYNVILYQSGKCLVQGKGAADFVQFVLEPLVLQDIKVGYEDILNPEAIQPHMGVDESGKGDLFGPLVIAAAFVDPTLAPTLREMNVRDSKQITSDDKALELGRDLRKLLGQRFSVVTIGPRAYNRLYSRMKNVNAILSWGHARAIENLLEVVPNCPRAVSDQFGSTRQVLGALMKKGRKIELIQKPRAESDLAVAAASIIAREMFLRTLRTLAERYKSPMPKGASQMVRNVAVELVKKHGPSVLLEIAKCHFRTVDQILQAVGMDRSALGPEGLAVSKLARDQNEADGLPAASRRPSSATCRVPK